MRIPALRTAPLAGPHRCFVRNGRPLLHRIREGGGRRETDGALPTVRPPKLGSSAPGTPSTHAPP